MDGNKICVEQDGITVVHEKNELIPIRLVTRWCDGLQEVEYVDSERSLTNAFMDHMLECLVGREGWYYFLYCYSGYNKIFIASEDQEKSIFTYSLEHLYSKGCPLGYVMRRELSIDA